MRFAIAGQEIGCRRDQCAKVRGDKFNVIKDTIVLPQAVQDERGFVFLYGELWVTVSIHPGMPTAAPGAVRVIFVHQEAAWSQHRVTKIVKHARDF